MASETDEQQEIRHEFDELVNMAPKELERWLATDESQEVGWGKDEGGESVGHESGRRIVKLQNTRKDDLSDDDYAHMKKVNAYIKRHTEQGPPQKQDAETSRWRYSLMNWGHDPQKG